MKTRHHPPAAFTLIELLVVVSVVAILIAMILPALSKATGNAKRLKCMANQRAVSPFVHCYLNDYKGFLPASYDGTGSTTSCWYAKLASLYLNTPISVAYWGIGNGKGVEKMFLCPAAINQATDGNGVHSGNISFGWNYFALTHFDNTIPTYNGQTAQITQVMLPEQTVMTTESDGPVSYAVRPRLFKGLPFINATPVNRHDGKANYLMIDGHAQTLTDAEGAATDIPYWRMKK